MALEKASNEVKTKKEITQVVSKLPVQEIRRLEQEDTIINFVTVEEYLTQMANAGNV